MANTEYSVYIVRCADDTYYTGIAADVARRIAEHESSPRGAKYLKGRGPLTLVYSASVGDRASDVFPSVAGAASTELTYFKHER